MCYRHRLRHTQLLEIPNTHYTYRRVTDTDSETHSCSQRHTVTGNSRRPADSHGIPLHNNATHCNTLQHTATHCNTLQRLTCRASLHNALAHTATHCNTLQHTATHCNTLQHDSCEAPKIEMQWPLNTETKHMTATHSNAL